jgi:hypothetical protein
MKREGDRRDNLKKMRRVEEKGSQRNRRNRWWKGKAKRGREYRTVGRQEVKS